MLSLAYCRFQTEKTKIVDYKREQMKVRVIAKNNMKDCKIINPQIRPEQITKKNATTKTTTTKNATQNTTTKKTNNDKKDEDNVKGGSTHCLVGWSVGGVVK